MHTTRTEEQKCESKPTRFGTHFTDSRYQERPKVEWMKAAHFTIEEAEEKRKEIEKAIALTQAERISPTDENQLISIPEGAQA